MKWPKKIKDMLSAGANKSIKIPVYTSEQIAHQQAIAQAKRMSITSCSGIHTINRKGNTYIRRVKPTATVKVVEQTFYRKEDIRPE
jgi:hypothetical protein